ITRQGRTAAAGSDAGTRRYNHSAAADDCRMPHVDESQRRSLRIVIGVVGGHIHFKPVRRQPTQTASDRIVGLAAFGPQLAIDGTRHAGNSRARVSAAVVVSGYVTVYVVGDSGNSPEQDVFGERHIATGANIRTVE